MNKAPVQEGTEQTFPIADDSNTTCFMFWEPLSLHN